MSAPAGRRGNRARRGRVAVAALATTTLLAACSGDDTATGDDETSGTPTESVSPTTPPSTIETTAAPRTTTTTPAPTTTVAESTTTTIDPVTGDLSAVLARALGEAIGSSGFPEPDPMCFDQAIDAFGRPERHTVDRLLDDAQAWAELTGDKRYPVVLTYLACIERETLANWVVLSTVRTFDQIDCVRASWPEGVEPEVLATSLAYGDGFDDLPPASVDGLTAAALSCEPDPQWWLEDEASVLEQNGAPPDLAECVAAAYVDTLGAEAVVRRRILTFDHVAATPEQLAAVDLAGKCAMTAPAPVLDLGVQPGDCVIRFGEGARSTSIISCDLPHNGEVVSIVDLAASTPHWPGVAALEEAASIRCLDDIAPLIGDHPSYAVGWDIPDRWSWESSARTLTCVLVRDDFSYWDGPSGLVPTAAPTAGTPPIGEVVDDFTTVAVGTCLRFTPDGSSGGVAVEVAACAEPHSGELFHRLLLDGAPGAPFPGDAQVDAGASAGCSAGFAMYVGIPIDRSRLSFITLYPNQATWDLGDRNVTCILVDAFGAPLDRSMAGSQE